MSELSSDQYLSWRFSLIANIHKDGGEVGHHENAGEWSRQGHCYLHHLLSVLLRGPQGPLPHLVLSDCLVLRVGNTTVKLCQPVSHAADVEVEGTFLSSEWVVFYIVKGTEKLHFPLYPDIDGVLGTLIDLWNSEGVQPSRHVGGLFFLLIATRCSFNSWKV